MTWEPVQFWGKMEQLVCLCEMRHLQWTHQPLIPATQGQYEKEIQNYKAQKCENIQLWELRRSCGGIAKKSYWSRNCQPENQKGIKVNVV